MWYKSDPRNYFDKSGHIIAIVNGRACKGFVYTDEGWNIELSNYFFGAEYHAIKDQIKFVDEHDAWEDRWLWCLDPTIYKTEATDTPDHNCWS